MKKFLFLGLLAITIAFQATAIFAPIFHWVNGITSTTHQTEMSAGQSMASDQNLNVYATGHFRGTMDFDMGAGIALLTSDALEDIYVSKSNPWGELIWVKKMGSSGSDQGWGVVVDDSENVYITGFFEDTVDFDPGPAVHQLISKGGKDLFVCKLDINGNFVWAKSIGGADDDKGAAICVTRSDIYVSGSFRGTVDFDPSVGTAVLTSNGFDDVFVLKLDKNGTFDWARQIGGLLSEAGTSIIADSMGNTFTAGYFQSKVDFDPSSSTSTELESKVGHTDAFVLKLDSLGNFGWAKQFGGGSYTYNYGITLDRWEHIYIAGAFTDTADFDPNAGTSNRVSAGLFDAFVCKLDSNGHYLWAKQQGGVGNDQAYGVVVNDDFNIFTVGSFEGSADFNPSAVPFSLTSNGKKDIFLSQFDSAGNFHWADKGGGLENDVAVSITKSRYMCGAIYLTGYYSSKADFRMATSSITEANDYGIFVASYNQCVLNINEAKQTNNEGQLMAYPSPFTHHLYIQSQYSQHASVYNCFGQKVLDVELKKGINDLATDSFLPGLYLLRNENGGIINIEKR